MFINGFIRLGTHLPYVTNTLFISRRNPAGETEDTVFWTPFLDRFLCEDFYYTRYHLYVAQVKLARVQIWWTVRPQSAACYCVTKNTL